MPSPYRVLRLQCSVDATDFLEMGKVLGEDDDKLYITVTQTAEDGDEVNAGINLSRETAVEFAYAILREFQNVSTGYRE